MGNAGLFVTLTQFLIAYSILLFTVASVCAISTNGAVEGGGAYCILFSSQAAMAYYTLFIRNMPTQLTRYFESLSIDSLSIDQFTCSAYISQYVIICN